MIESLSESGRTGLRHAESEARERGHGEIEIGHLVLGSLLAPATTSAVAAHVDVDLVRRGVASTLRGSTRHDGSDVPFTTAARSALERAHECVIARGRHHVDAIDLLRICVEEFAGVEPASRDHVEPSLLAGVTRAAADVVERTADTAASGVADAPGFVDEPRVSVRSRSRTTTFDTAEALAGAFGTPIYLPHAWPESLGAPRYVLSWYEPGFRDARYAARWSTDGGVRLIVGSDAGASSAQPGAGPWEPVDDLDDLDGVARVLADARHVSVRQGEHRVDLVGFSIDVAIALARDLRPVAPG